MRKPELEKIKKERMSEIIEMYEQGYSSAKIGMIVGVEASTIIYWLKKSNVKIRSSNSYEDYVLMPYIKRFVEGEPSTRLAKEMGISRQSFVGLMRRRGITRHEKQKKEEWFDDLEVLEDYDFYVPTDRKTGETITIKGKRYKDVTYEFTGG